LEDSDSLWALCPIETETGTIALSDFLWHGGDRNVLFVGSRTEPQANSSAGWYLEGPAHLLPWDLVEHADGTPSAVKSSTQNTGPIDLNLVDAVPLEPLDRIETTRREEGSGGAKPPGQQTNFDSEIPWTQETLWSRDFRRSLWEKKREPTPEPSPAKTTTTTFTATATAAATATSGAGRGVKRKVPEVLVIDDDIPQQQQQPAVQAPRRGRPPNRGKGKKK
jgi:hypothetical protein